MGGLIQGRRLFCKRRQAREKQGSLQIFGQGVKILSLEREIVTFSNNIIRDGD
jgi:hypothetical protein